MENLAKAANRALFVLAIALAVLAVWEKVANLVGRTLVVLGGYSPSRLLELAAIALLFVIALQLREIRERGSGEQKAG
jgi:hypothetical protein